MMMVMARKTMDRHNTTTKARNPHLVIGLAMVWRNLLKSDSSKEGSIDGTCGCAIGGGCARAIWDGVLWVSMFRCLELCCGGFSMRVIMWDGVCVRWARGIGWLMMGCVI